MALSSRLQRLRSHWASTPWLHWAATVAALALYFLVIKLQSLAALLTMYAAPGERTVGHKFAGVVLGMLEDLVVILLLMVAMLVVALLRLRVHNLIPKTVSSSRVLQIVYKLVKRLGHGVRFVVVVLLTLLTLSFATIDLLLVRAREIHFTTDLVATYWRERNQGAGTLELERREVTMIIATMVAMVVTALVFTVFYVCCVDLLLAWRPSDREKNRLSVSRSTHSPRELESSLQRDQTSHTAVYHQVEDLEKATQYEQPPCSTGRWKQLSSRKRLAVVVVATAAVGYVVLVAATCGITHAAHPLVTAIALNASLNELFRGVVGIFFTHSAASGKIDAAAYFLQPPTESYVLFQDDVLFRTTTGFNGSLAFNVSVDHDNPPNVLVLVVESFRYLDSLYLAWNTSAGAVMEKHNLTVTPEFDRWAKRGVAFSNMWASWQTSRSLESILFSQVVYDSLPVSGTSRGRVDTKLVGMPQMFSNRGYETIFTTGGNTSYDQWDQFLPAHGFETMLGAEEMKQIAEKSNNISKNDWWGDARRAFTWGVHDDVSYPIVADMMIQKVQEQTQRVEHGEPKKPFFLNHYTISSHFPFRALPTWFDGVAVPDFSPLCEDWDDDKCAIILDYAKLRYFADMELGKFMDTMQAANVLNDTIVVIVGDHGQSPEMGLANPVLYDTAVQHVAGALVAEGRLGRSAGLVLDDATHQNDIQNTLADILGVDGHGFLQTGVGRSLKRAVPFGERLVWSNNPWRRKSIVRGHERFVYDALSNRIALFDTIRDPLETTDLLPTLSEDEAAKWHMRWRAGRQLNTYYKKRWDERCLAQVHC